MPEGPSLVILREESSRFVGKTIANVAGNTRALDLGRLAGQPVVSMRTFGKQFLIELPRLAIRILFLLFGSYRIDERKPDRVPRLSLGFDDGTELNFYACSVREIGNDLDALYDWSADVMSPTWDAARARKKLRAAPEMLACDALLDQDIFAGVGNIIKNEVLFRIRLHPPVHHWRDAGAQAEGAGGTGARIQFRLPGVEKKVRAKKTLASARPDHLPALQHSVC